MEQKLIAAYLALQLNPNNDQQTAAFEALCWKHLLERTSSYWVQQVQSGALPLVREIRTDSSTRKKIYAYDHTLDRLTFEFVQDYARAIWPSTEEKRSYLMSSADKNFKLKAVGPHIRAPPRTQAKLERDLGRPCTEQMIVVESLLGRKVRSFLTELVTTREAPSVDGYSAKEAIQTILESFETNASTVAPRHPEITSARFPCRYPGCNNIYALSEALATHVNLAHAILRPSLPDTTTDLQTLPASNASIVHDDTPTAVQRPMSVWGLPQWSHTRRGFAGPTSFGATSSHQPAPVVGPNPNSTSMHSPIILSDDDDDDEGNASSLLSMPPDHRADAQTGSIVPVSSGIAALRRAGPISNSNPYNAEGVSVISLDDDEDSEDDVSGLLCPHAGCQLRFPNWASFENHAQLPHDKGARASSGDELSTANAAIDHDGLRDATNALGGRDGSKVQDTQLQQGLLLEGSLSGGTIRWRNMAGERM